MSDANSTLEAIGLKELEFERALAWRERFEGGPEREARPAGLPTAADVSAIPVEQIRAMVSGEAYRKTIEFETGGKGYYDRKLKRPSWPGASSGVTIGVGYDVGYHSENEVQADWGDQMPGPHLEKLLATIGVTGERARGLAGALSDISVPWEVAEVVFVRATLPKYARLVVQNLPNVRLLHPHAFGALFSLVFNRGPSFYRDGDRFTEMRNIARHMQAKAFDRIPAEIVAMKRLWGSELSGLHKRRDAEAALFRKGLDEAASPRPVATEPVATGVIAPTFPGTNVPVVAAQGFEAAVMEAAGMELAGEADENLLDREIAFEAAPKRPRPEADSGRWYEEDEVAWTKDDDKSPDYRHIPDRALAATAFSLTARDLDLLIEANRFKPVRDEGRILFALRGCQLAGGKSQIDQDSLKLKEARPDHRNFRCVIGVYNTANGRLSGFVASTVPYYTSVHRGWEKEKRKERPFNGNMLSTGLYPYIVGPHGSRQIPGCFLQGTAFDKRAKVVVLRTHNDVSYDTADLWHCCVPHDNLHPAFNSTGFSSEGCQTVRGTYANGGHTADFAALREAAGLGRGKDNGKRFDYLLLTGLEAAIASNLRERGLASDKGLVDALLGRLRQGSQGDEVRRLQKALGRPETAVLDADDRAGLVARQKAKLGFADAVFSPDWDRQLGYGVFGAPAPAFDPASVPLNPLESARVAILDDRTSGTLRDDVARARRMALAGASADSLFYEIGLRSQIAARSGDTGLEAGVARSAPEFGFNILKSVGESIFSRAERELHTVLCGGDPSNDATRDQIAGAMARAMKPAKVNGGNGAATPSDDAGEARESARGEAGPGIELLTRILVSRLGILPLIAEPIAALLLQHVFKSTMTETCEAWSARLGTPAMPKLEAASIAPISAVRMKTLLGATDAELYEAIGRESRDRAAAAMGGLGLEAFDMTSLFASGQLIYQTAEAHLYAILCGDDAASRTIRERIGMLYEKDMGDRAAIATAIAGLLVAKMAFLPLVAAPIAALLVSKVFKSGLDETCKYWGAYRSQGRTS